MKPSAMTAANGERRHVPACVTVSQPQRRQIRSDELFSGQREVLIEHAGELYLLRHTSKGKLILTK